MKPEYYEGKRKRIRNDLLKKTDKFSAVTEAVRSVFVRNHKLFIDHLHLNSARHQRNTSRHSSTLQHHAVLTSSTPNHTSHVLPTHTCHPVASVTTLVIRDPPL